ncbi:hypothetical protein C8Q76DRAFT_730554 [Earliella scabrosa]|nr:hypothetical protein C8Q76DRAFT_730554 [Earliella scabrosa]
MGCLWNSAVSISFPILHIFPRTFAQSLLNLHVTSQHSIISFPDRDQLLHDYAYEGHGDVDVLLRWFVTIVAVRPLYYHPGRTT